MARACSVCGKDRAVGNNVSHANNKTKRLWRPNLQSFRANLAGTVRRVLVCTRCLRSGKLTKVSGSRPASAAAS